MTITLNTQQPFTRTYGPDLEKTPNFQNGLYFGHNGELLHNDHNHAVLKKRGISHADAYEGESTEQEAEVETDAESTFNKKAYDVLRGKTGSEIYTMAARIRADLDDREAEGETVDGYQPKPDAREDNMAFIARNTEE